ncbi:hypothetical protein ILUMI_13488 [Ignelater luminosus]|uniref:Uncharacterized protein n=1 Tax=Ignelater luminosus TaxID=2038154 RepID=A0A8K0CSA9_IGNLU|nr:hypothetical protein ILUMI_13488 [Ignelater luminosus]
MIIGFIDKLESLNILKNQKTISKEKLSRNAEETVEIYKSSCSFIHVSDTNYKESESVQTDPPFIISTNNKKRIINDDREVLETKGPSSKQMRVKFSSVAPACNRTSISDRSAAIIASAVLRDVGIISKEDPSFIVDRSKIRRQGPK